MDLFDQAPATGAAFLSRCPGLQRAAEIISNLHENVDGSGSPKGLKRRYIPLTARILAVADLLDDMVNGFAGFAGFADGSVKSSVSSPIDVQIDVSTDALADASADVSVNGSVSGPGRGAKRPPLDALPNMLSKYSGTRLDPRVVNILEYHVVTCMDGQSAGLKEMGFHQLKPGMTMGAGVYAKTGTKLFSAGAVLSEESITMLMKYNRQYPLVETVFVKVE
jgi:hypothetical protein